jgi:hypothetical protein
VSQPEDAASSDPISVPRKAAHPFRGGRSRGWPRPRQRLDAACQPGSRAHQRGMDRHQLDRGSHGQRHPPPPGQWRWGARCQLRRRARCLTIFVTRLIVTFALAPLPC